MHWFSHIAVTYVCTVSHTHAPPHIHTQQQTSMHSELISDLFGQVLGSEVLLAIRCVQHLDQLQLHQLRHQLHNIALRQPENKASSLYQQLITQVHNTVLIHLILILVTAKIYYTTLCSNNLTLWQQSFISMQLQAVQNTATQPCTQTTWEQSFISVPPAQNTTTQHCALNFN